MIDRVLQLPPEQQAFRDKCFHPSGTFVEFPKEEVEQSISERFEKIVSMYPDHPAVKMGDRSLTYRDLNQAANHIGRAIYSERGATVEPVMLISRHALSTVAACLGILKSGKILVVADPSFPFERLSHMVENSQAGAIVTDASNLPLAEKLAKNERRVIDIDALGNPLPENLGLEVRVPPHTPALIVFSSGSTGQPKGIFYNHRRILHDVMVEMNAVHICSEDRIIHLRKLSFGAGIKGLFRSLLSGATLVCYDVYTGGLAKLPDFLIEAGITIFPPGVPIFRHFVAQLNGAETFRSIRLVTLACETVSHRDIEAYRKIFSDDCLLLHHYSSSEAGLVCQYFIDKKTELNTKAIPIGYPVEDKAVFLRDENGKTLGCDYAGEIAIKSRHLSSGYWRNSELTNAKFLADPEGGDECIYLTGDYGQMLPDGSLVFLGRKDFAIKIRGYTVEISEIERTLLTHPGIKEAGVVAWDREPGEKYLIAYVVSRGSTTLPVDNLRGFLRATLPDYMIPSAFVFLESLPLTNGKLDRTALPMPNHKRPDLSHAYVQARNEIEEILVQLWKEILDLRPIGIHDNFFDLGGHSLAATRVVSQVIQRFQLELPLQSLFAAPTVAEMAAVIEAHQGKKVGEADLEGMLAELESLSDDEARRLIAEESGK